MLEKNIFYATGKRKTAVAKTWMKSGSGIIEINGKSVDKYFKLNTMKSVLLQPLILTNTVGNVDIKVKVSGGGCSGQAGAVRHGITRALIKYDPEFRILLKRSGFITRDSRIKERKKYGQRGARARFQFSKR